MDSNAIKIEMLNAEIKKLNETIVAMNDELDKVKSVLVFIDRRLAEVETHDKDLDDYAQQLFDAHS